MNTKIIRVRFSHFLGEFEKNEFKMVMQFLKLVLMEYDENPLSILDYLMQKETQTASTKILNGSQPQSNNTETLQLTPNSFQTFQPHLGLQLNQSRPSFDSHLLNVSRTKQIINPLSTKILNNNPHNKSNPYNFYAQKTNETIPEFHGEFPDNSQDETEIYEEAAQLMSESINNESDQHSPYEDGSMQGKNFNSNGSSSPSAQNHELNNTQQHLDESQYQSAYFLNQMLPVNLPEQNVDKTGRLKNKNYFNKPHKCFICQKAFSNKSHLTDHIRIHTGEKPFHCDLCGRSFNVKSNLLTHLRNHAGEKQFKCNYCDEAFDRKKSLEVHLKFHETNQQGNNRSITPESSTKSNLETIVNTFKEEKIDYLQN